MRGWITSLLLAAALAACGEAETEGPSTPTQAEADVRFEDVTAAAGLGGFTHQTGAFGEKWFPETMGAGGGFLDYDGDGHLDIVLVSGDVWPGHGDARVPALRLYRNNGDGTFTERTTEAGLAEISAYGFGVTAADYDNDGDDDLYLTTLYENLLFRNDGGVFAEVGRAAGVAGPRAWSTAALFFDADQDGHLDLYVGSYVTWTPDTDIWCTVDGKTKNYCTPILYEGLGARFYRSNGDGTFTEQSEASGLGGQPGKTLGVAELDVNSDGWPDLAVANDLQRDLLFINNGDGTFREQGLASGIAFDENGIARSGMGIDAGVVDTTGQATLFVGNFSNEMIGVYRHVGGGLFIDRAGLSGIGRPSLLTLTFGLFLFDVDLDGDLDLFTANGEVRENIEALIDGLSYRQRPQLFRNAGDGRFDLVQADAGPLAQQLVGRGAAYGDYDGDGDLDVLVTENGGPARLWRNDTAGGSALRVALKGATGNRDALGARVVVVAGGRRQERRVRTGGSYLSQSEKVVTFGLGAATRADSLVVYWPGGRVDRFAGVDGGRTVRVEEGRGVVEERRASATKPG